MISVSLSESGIAARAASLMRHSRRLFFSSAPSFPRNSRKDESFCASFSNCLSAALRPPSFAAFTIDFATVSFAVASRLALIVSEKSNLAARNRKNCLVKNSDKQERNYSQAETICLSPTSRNPLNARISFFFWSGCYRESKFGLSGWLQLRVEVEVRLLS